MPLADAHDYPVWLNAGIFLIAAVVVWSAGVRLTHFVDRVAARTGLGEAFVGMLFLGGITSLPEIANVINASSIGNPALAINNLLGSAAINVLLLAVADAWVGRDAVTSVVAKPSTMMMAALCMIVLVTVAMAIATTDALMFSIGIWSTLICAMSIGAFWLSASYDRRSPWVLKGGDPEPEREEEAETDDTSLRSLVIKTAAAGAMIFAAGYTLSQTGDALAEQTGLGTGIVGFALIGLSTSLPELSSILTALRIRRYEMAFGQVLGTNFINLSLIFLADGVFTGGPVINQIGRFETISALLGAVLIGVFLVGLLERRNPTVMRMGWDSLAVIILFAAGLGILATIQ